MEELVQNQILQTKQHGTLREMNIFTELHLVDKITNAVWAKYFKFFENKNDSPENLRAEIAYEQAKNFPHPFSEIKSESCEDGLCVSMRVKEDFVGDVYPRWAKLYKADATGNMRVSCEFPGYRKANEQ